MAMPAEVDMAQSDLKAPVSVAWVSKNVVIGVCLAIGGNLLISVSMNIQKCALSRLQQRHPPDEAGRPAYQYLTSGIWWGGILLMIVGEGGNFFAYGFGPASVIAPLGTTTVVANAYISRCLGERLRFQDILGTVIIVIGAFMIVVFSSQNDEQLTAPQILHHLKSLSFIFYVATEFILFLVLSFMKFVQRVRHILLYLLPAALLGSLTVLGAKACSMLVALAIQGDPKQLLHPIFYIMLAVVVVSGVCQIIYVTGALQEHDASVVVPVFFVFFTLSAILIGVFFYNEMDGVNAVNVFMFIFGCICSFTGVFMITSGRDLAEDENEDFLLELSDSGDDQSSESHSPMLPLATSVHLVQPPRKDPYPGETDTLSDSSEGTEVEMQDMSNLLRDNIQWPPAMDKAVFNPQMNIEGDSILNECTPLMAGRSDEGSVKSIR